MDASIAAHEMIDAARFFHGRGWLMGTCGNLSIKLSDEPWRVLVTPSGKDKSRLQTTDFLLVDEHSQSVGAPGKASDELGVHQEIYRRTSAKAVYHVHSISNNLASFLWREAGNVRIRDVEMIKGIAGKTLGDRLRIPIVDNSQDMQQLAANVAAGIRPDVPAVLVYQHGIYAWGDDPASARRHIEVLEFLLEYAVQVASLSLRRSRPSRQLPVTGLRAAAGGSIW